MPAKKNLFLKRFFKLYFLAILGGESKELTMNKSQILLVEDSQSLAIVYKSYIEKEGHSVCMVDTGQAALDYIEKQIPKVILLDIQLPDMNGLEILKNIKAKELPSQVIIITAHGSVEIAVTAMQFGAFDFLTKPFDAARLNTTVKNALQHYKLTQIAETFQEEFARQNFHDFIGSSLAMQRVYRIIESAAPSKATVFVTGESGTGKELCASALHNQSGRKENSFVALNCAAIPKDLIESEIFGHVKGAFSGAVKDRQGAASLADGGTLFLDEVCEMEPELQTKLLRFVQTGTFQKVGSDKTVEVDIRFVCATNRDPLLEVKEGRFREDLYYRLHVIPISLPALREREDDVLQIASVFLKQYSQDENRNFKGFDRNAKNRLLNYEWPGNIRQLQNIVRNIVVLNQGDIVSLDMLPAPLDSTQGFANENVESVSHIDNLSVNKDEDSNLAETPSANDKIVPLWMVEKDTIDKAIALCDGNIPKAASMLEISASTIYRKKQSWGE